MIFLSIDIQPGFAAAADHGLIKVAQEEVKRAMRYNYGIVFLEYKGHGETFSQIKNIAHDYDNKITVEKNTDDGGLDVLDAAFQHNLSVNHIRVCGVYTGMCVYHTLFSLTSLSPSSKVLVRKDGCRPLYDTGGFSRIRKLKNVRVVNGE